MSHTSTITIISYKYRIWVIKLIVYTQFKSILKFIYCNVESFELKSLGFKIFTKVSHLYTSRKRWRTKGAWFHKYMIFILILDFSGWKTAERLSPISITRSRLWLHWLANGWFERWCNSRNFRVIFLNFFEFYFNKWLIQELQNSQQNQVVSLLWNFLNLKNSSPFFIQSDFSLFHH